MILTPIFRSAITTTAIREPRYQRADVCWSECVERWKKAKLFQYPSFEEWKDIAAGCDGTAHLVPEVRGVMEPTKRVAPHRFATLFLVTSIGRLWGIGHDRSWNANPSCQKMLLTSLLSVAQDSWMFNRGHETGSAAYHHRDSMERIAVPQHSVAGSKAKATNHRGSAVEYDFVCH